MKIMLEVFIGFIIFILLLFNIFAWIKLKPPKSVLLTMPKIIYPSIVLQSVVIMLISLNITIGMYYHKRISITGFYKGVFLILIICFINSLVICYKIYFSSINHSVNSKSVKTNKVARSFKNNKIVELDLKKNFPKEINNIVQFNLSYNEDTNRENSCIVYLNYGGWIRDKDSHISEYLKKELNLNGYSFAVLSARDRKETNLIGIIKDIKVAVNYLKECKCGKKIDKVILVGGSAGAHLALNTAFSESEKEFDIGYFRGIDGVIALYPTVDLDYNYNYFNENRENDFLDMLGDKLFSSVDSINKAPSVAQSTKMNMENLLGGSPKEVPRMYEISKIKNLINSSNNIPALIIQGSHDSNTPVEPVRVLYDEMKKRKMKVSFLELPLVEHAFDVMFPNSSIVGIKVKREIINWIHNYN